MNLRSPYVRWFAELRNTDVPEVGGKNASLGELYRRSRKRAFGFPTALP